MAEFDYEVVDGRKIRVRPQEVVSEICGDMQEIYIRSRHSDITHILRILRHLLI